ncbi:hypothetical protein HWV54_01980 [Bartonella alsatica]|uniref:Uncharacterized protein n=1 Tax=Bartonella alsatica TaxID=52764 RepID=A0ABX6QF05_9HYPH|nr:hypothetical protein HWV54_01980 [Bartonella alsatica]
MRKLAATRAAAGVTVSQMQALFGWAEDKTGSNKKASKRSRTNRKTN